MGFGVGTPDLAVYRMVKAGESGLNLQLSDLYDRRIEVPDLLTILKTLFTRRKWEIKVKGFPVAQIFKLQEIQRIMDKKVKEAVDKAKRQMR